MQRDMETVVLDMPGGSGVVAIVAADEPAHDVLCRAMKEAVVRSGGLTVFQLVDDRSAVRRSLAKAVLGRDVAWWARDQVGVTASIDMMADASVASTVAHVHHAACIVMAAGTADSERARAIMGPVLDRVDR